MKTRLASAAFLGASRELFYCQEFFLKWLLREALAVSYGSLQADSYSLPVKITLGALPGLKEHKVPTLGGQP